MRILIPRKAISKELVLIRFRELSAPEGLYWTLEDLLRKTEKIYNQLGVKHDPLPDGFYLFTYRKGRLTFYISYISYLLLPAGFGIFKDDPMLDPLDETPLVMDLVLPPGLIMFRSKFKVN